MLCAQQFARSQLIVYSLEIEMSGHQKGPRVGEARFHREDCVSGIARQSDLLPFWLPSRMVN